MKHKHDLLGRFVSHKVAPNILMIIMLMLGAIALQRLNIQFFPTFTLDRITINTIWSGSSAEDIEEGITTPLEQRLRQLENLKKMNSTSAPGVSGITLEFEEGTDPIVAIDDVKQLVSEFRKLPADAEAPEVKRVVRSEPVARLLISGLEDEGELRRLVRRFEGELLRQGIDKVDVRGLPNEKIAIEVATAQMQEIGLSLAEIGQQINTQSQDFPAGVIGDTDIARELRSLNKRREPNSFADIPIVTKDGARLDLAAVADISRQPVRSAHTISVAGERAVEMLLSRSESGNSLHAAQVLDDWLAATRPTLPPNVKIEVFDASWQLIKDRIDLLVSNGLGGLALVLIILYLFLTGRVAFWVAVGIPVSFMATLAILWAAGGSINMISLFALIMAIGIIVDDAIVVGEDAQAHFDMGEDPLKASEGGARRMLAPVMASSLTTIASFLPLMLIGGIIGNILFAIPLVIVSVIIASVIESFFVLPGHLRHVFKHAHRERRHRIRERLDGAFNYFRDAIFRPLITTALTLRWATLAFAVAALILSIGLLAGGRIGFVFFPSPESPQVYANVRFTAGTPKQVVARYVAEMESALVATEKALGGDLVATTVVHQGSTTGAGRGIKGDTVASIFVELMPPDQRSVRNREFIRAWKDRLDEVAGIESLTIASRRSGPPGKEVELRLTGDDAHVLKQISLRIQEQLKSMPGVSDVDDDLAYGREQWVYTLLPAGERLGLTVRELGQQLRVGYDGQLLQVFQDGADEVEVRIQLPQAQQQTLASLAQFPVRLADGRFVPLFSVAKWHSRQGFESLRHADGQLAVEVTADVDNAVNNTNEVIALLRDDLLPEITQSHDVRYSFEGRAADQRETMADMKLGAQIGLFCIYLVLAWVFSSYGWPLVVMMTIPLGLTGAVLGHWVMDMQITLLSLFGFFALSGIVVNDSIILVTFYKDLKQKGIATQQALVDAACLRLRAVLLTSLTTIAGLTPLLFETSTQAQFLIPMATSIAFGLGFATLLILLVVPSMLSIYESVADRRAGIATPT